MAALHPPEADPLVGHYKYQKVRFLSSGSYGFVLLAVDKTSGDLVAIKFIERILVWGPSPLTTQALLAVHAVPMEMPAVSSKPLGGEVGGPSPA